MCGFCQSLRQLQISEWISAYFKTLHSIPPTDHCQLLHSSSDYLHLSLFLTLESFFFIYKAPHESHLFAPKLSSVSVQASGSVCVCVALKVSFSGEVRGLVQREKVSEVERGSERRRRRDREDRDQNNKQLCGRVGPLAGESRRATR